MAVSVQQGTKGKVFEDGPDRVGVYNNTDSTQVVLLSDRFQSGKKPYVIIPESLVREVGLELFEQGCKQARVTR